MVAAKHSPEIAALFISRGASIEDISKHVSKRKVKKIERTLKNISDKSVESEKQYSTSNEQRSATTSASQTSIDSSLILSKASALPPGTMTGSDNLAIQGIERILKEQSPDAPMEGWVDPGIAALSYNAPKPSECSFTKIMALFSETTPSNVIRSNEAILGAAAESNNAQNTSQREEDIEEKSPESLLATEASKCSLVF